MYATIETLAGVIRVHEDGHEETYTWSCCATLNIHCGTAALYGAIRAPNLREVRAMKRMFQSIGISEVNWERRTGAAPGKHRRIT